MKWALTKIYEGIYLLEMNDAYDLAMHFLRAQEYYESPNPMFRNHKFSIIDLMEWYSKENNNCFTYATDWVGFNIPSRVLEDLYIFGGFSDFNKYDLFMRNIHYLISGQENSYYLIGAKFGEVEDKDHELAHAFFYTNQEYKKQTLQLLNTIDTKIIDCFRYFLTSNGYTDEVVEDEIQAYMATGLTETMNEFVLDKMHIKQKELDAICKTIQNIFQKFKKELDNG